MRSSYYRKALVSGRLSADSLFCLGMSQLQSRQKAAARGTLNQALLAGLQEPLATEAKQALADTQGSERAETRLELQLGRRVDKISRKGVGK